MRGHCTHLTCHVSRYLSHYTIFEIRNTIWEIKRPDFGNQTFVQDIGWEKINNQARISDSILNTLGKHKRSFSNRNREILEIKLECHLRNQTRQILEIKSVI